MKTSALTITKHAYKRFKQRTGLPKRNIESHVGNALTNGIPYESLSGQIKTYLKKISKKPLANSQPRLHNGFVWIFIGTRLITLYPLPGQFNKYLIN